MNGMYPINPLTMGSAMFSPYYNTQNPIIPNYPVIQQQTNNLQRKVECVNGKESAMTFPMGPNSSVILVDNLSPRIFLVTTDASGYKSVRPFKVSGDDDDEDQMSPIAQTEESVVKEDEKVIALKERIDKLEERLQAYEQLNKSNAEYSYTSKPSNGNAQPNDQNGKNSKGSNGRTQSDSFK